MIGPVDKTCGRCGSVFVCGQYACWCRDLSVSDRQYDRIAAQYADCLCRPCLVAVTRIAHETV